MTDAANPLPWDVLPQAPRLVPGEVHVVAFALDVPMAVVTELEDLLARDEAERAARFHQARDRRRYIVGRARLRLILGGYLDRAAAQLGFHYGTQGKPELRGGGSDARIRFNLSRAHELGVLALQLDEELGIDIELIRPFPDALHVAARFFTPDEHAALRDRPVAELDAAFFHYWTRKEAVLKSLGLGVSQPMDAFTLLRQPPAAGELVIVGGGAETATRWVAEVPLPSPGYVAALAMSRPSPPPRYRFWRTP